MAGFDKSVPSMTRRYQNKHTHGGNHAPSVADWFKGDDTLDRQGTSGGRPNGHGICKGTASAWVTAFLNGVPEAVDPERYEDYYTNFLRYQATMTKDFGGHIDRHVAQLAKLGVDAGIVQARKFEAAALTEAHIPQGRWGAYISVWHHDIAAGGTWGTGSKLYIVEPNTGLLGYNNKVSFFSDLDAYISSRRSRKRLPPTEKAGFWIYRPG